VALLGWLYSMYRRDPRAMRLWENGLAMVGAGAAPSTSPAPNPNARKRRRKKR
jgi:hypothetical protein